MHIWRHQDKCHRAGFNILNKSDTPTPELFAVNIQNHANQECNWKYILSFTWKSFKCDRGPFFQVANLNRNLTQFMPTEIHYLRTPTARNGSLDMWQPEMWITYLKCVWSFRKAILKSGFSSNCQVQKFNTEISIGKSMCCCILVWGHY